MFFWKKLVGHEHKSHNKDIYAQNWIEILIVEAVQVLGAVPHTPVLGEFSIFLDGLGKPVSECLHSVVRPHAPEKCNLTHGHN